MQNKISNYLVITLILTLGFGQLLRFEFFGTPLYLHDLLVIIILTLQGLALKVKIPLSFKLFLTGLVFGWLFALLHYPFAELLVPSLYTLRLLAYLALYLVLKNRKITIPHFMFLFSGLVTLTIGLAQYILLPDMRVFKYLGWDDHLNRLILPHFDPTFTAVMLGLFLLSTGKLSSIFYILVLLFSIVGILLTYARSVWVSFIIALTFFIKNKLVLLLAVGCMLLAIFILPKKFGEGTNLLRTYSITSRFEFDLAYIKKYKWNLIIGRGMNTLVLDVVAPSTSSNHATGPNNSYLYLLATTGVLGLVGWGMFLLSLYRTSNHKSMLIFLFVASLFNNVMFYPFAILWVLLVEAMIPTST